MADPGALQIAARCKDLTFYERTADGTVWHGDGMWLMQQMKAKLPDFTVIPAYLSGNAMLNRMANGSLDVLPDTFGITHSRFQVKEYLYHLLAWPSLTSCPV